MLIKWTFDTPGVPGESNFLIFEKYVHNQTFRCSRFFTFFLVFREGPKIQ
jgi:hypothetical protein